MAKTEPRPSTARAATTQSAGKADRTVSRGTGPGAYGVSGGANIARADDSPSKSASYPRTASDYDGKSGTAQTQSTDLSQRGPAAPEPDMPAFVMYKDSGPKTSREREFAAWNASARERLAGAQERDLYPSPLERGTQAEIARGDKYAGSANKVSKPPQQAQ